MTFWRAACLPCCSIEEVLHNIDTSIQYGEDQEVKIRDFEVPAEEGEEGEGGSEDDE